MSSTRSETPARESHPTTDGPLPEFVDWILGAVIALGGFLMMVGGTALGFLVGRDTLQEAIEDEAVTVTIGTSELTDAQAVEVAAAVTTWTGIGLLLTGIALVVFAVGYVVVRHRAHRRIQAGESVSSYSAHVVLGAVATAVLSFVPFSPALGGGLAGYLERGESDRTVSAGALAGLLPMVPVLVFLLFFLGGMITGLLEINRGGSAVFVGIVTFLMLMIVATIGTALGALGGYLGGQFAENRLTST